MIDESPRKLAGFFVAGALQLRDAPQPHGASVKDI
jgi:hypothetical protein